MDVTEQFIRYLCVGALAASVDFLGYNVFLARAKSGNRVLASVFSVSIAMILSFLLNRGWAFSGVNDGSWPVVEFTVVTLVAAYGIQSGVIWLLSGKGGSVIRATCQVLLRRMRAGDGNSCDGSGLGLPAKSPAGDSGAGCAVWRIGWRTSENNEVGLEILERNVVKALAVGVALIWNFSWYRWYVFV